MKGAIPVPPANNNVGFSNFELVDVENDDFTYTADSYPDFYQYVVRLEYHGDFF